MPPQAEIDALAGELRLIADQVQITPEDRLRLVSGYDLIVGPIFEEVSAVVERLYLIPDGPLEGFPFEMLMRQKPGRQARYLCQDLDLIFGCGVIDLAFVEQREDEGKEERRGIAALGRTSGELGNTAFASSSRSLSLRPLEAYADDEATRLLFADRATSDRLEHVVRMSRILVQVDRDLLEADWPLARLPHLDMKTDLALLLQREEPDSYSDLVRGVMASGARAVGVARWLPDPANGERFLGTFYEGLSRGLTLGAAARVARQELIAAGRPPRDWAWLRIDAPPTARAPIDRRSLPVGPKAVAVGIFGLAVICGMVALIFMRRLRPQPHNVEVLKSR